jgi:hypothetical protein
MNSFQKIGGIAALFEALIYVTIVVFVFLVLPSQGLSGPEALQDPFKVLPVVARSAILSIFNLHSIAVAVALLPVVLALHERLHQADAKWLPIATAAGIGGAVLFLVTGMVDFVALSQLARGASQDPAGAAIAFTAVMALRAAVGYAAIFSYGMWLLLVNGIGLRSGALPQPLAWIGLIFGTMGLLAFVIAPLAFIGPLVGIVWNSWLGVVLLRSAISMRASTVLKHA